MKKEIKDWISVALQETFPYIKRKFSNTSTLYETFIFQNYKWLCSDLRPNTFALDIGANIGDSAIYLAMSKEITKIYSFEPFPSLYQQAAANISKSGFDKKINLFNEGLGGTDSYIDISKKYTADVYSSTLKFKGEGNIRITTLDGILSKINSKNIIIKCDCEGAENEIFNGHNKLANVYKMQIEYHGGVKDLVKKVQKNGFRARYEAVENDVRLGECGWVYAWK